MKQKKLQMSDTFSVYILLALSGGCMDAYSYLFRGKVFANAQTGNMLLFGVNLAERNFEAALKYLFPIAAFSAGIMLSDFLRSKIYGTYIHWRQMTLIAEILILFSVCWIPLSYNAVANYNDTRN